MPSTYTFRDFKTGNPTTYQTPGPLSDYQQSMLQLYGPTGKPNRAGPLLGSGSFMGKPAADYQANAIQVGKYSQLPRTGATWSGPIPQMPNILDNQSKPISTGPGTGGYTTQVGNTLYPTGNNVGQPQGPTTGPGPMAPILDPTQSNYSGSRYRRTSRYF